MTAEGFADAAQRARWIAEKGMTVLNFHSDDHQDTPVDVFVTEPFDFNDEYRRALVEDLADVAELRLLHGEGSGE